MKTLLKFSADWCVPCRQMSALLNTVDIEGINLVEIDIDTDAETTAKYRVRGVPTLVLMEDGLELARTTGSKSKVELEKFLFAEYSV